MLSILLFFGLCFFGLGDCEDDDSSEWKRQFTDYNYEFNRYYNEEIISKNGVYFKHQVCNLENRCFDLDAENRDEDHYKIWTVTPTQGLQLYNYQGSSEEFPDFAEFCKLGYDFSNKGNCQVQLELLNLVKKVSDLEISVNSKLVLSNIEKRVLNFKNNCESDGNLFYYDFDEYPKCNHSNHSHNMLIEMNLDDWWLDIGYKSLQDWCKTVKNGELIYYDITDYYSCQYDSGVGSTSMNFYQSGGWYQSLQDLKPTQPFNSNVEGNKK